MLEVGFLEVGFLEVGLLEVRTLEFELGDCLAFGAEAAHEFRKIAINKIKSAYLIKTVVVQTVVLLSVCQERVTYLASLNRGHGELNRS